jgi:serine carboxypeptidase-like clade IV
VLKESRNAPATDPVILWLTGGPGCSSILALLSENGPYRMKPNSTDLIINPYSWNEKANVLYVDQPVGTGFSYSNTSKDYAHNEKKIAEDMYNFLKEFLQAFPKYANLKFAVTGESYAGHYIPALSARIVAGNAAGQGPKINFAGAAIGNGWTDPKIQYGAYITYARNEQLISKVFADELEAAYVACKVAIDSRVWLVAVEECQAIYQFILGRINFQRGAPMNPYNIKENCTYPPLCYDFGSEDKLLNDPVVQKALGVKTGIQWQECGFEVHIKLLDEWVTNFATDVATVLNDDFPVLVYNGDYDYICNWEGGAEWTDATKWKGQKEFQSASVEEWKVNGELAGWTKQYENFKFVRVHKAGHMVPLDQPANALAMINEFLSSL